MSGPPRLASVRALLGEPCDECGVITETATVATTREEHDLGVLALRRDPCGHVHWTEVFR